MTTCIPRLRRTTTLGLLAAAAATLPLRAQGLAQPEQRMRASVTRSHPEAVTLLTRVVNLPSGTFNVAGVRAVGAVFRHELDLLGFTTRWADLPPAMKRAGHLIAERHATRPAPNAKRILLIGHLDTVFEGRGQRFTRQDTVGRGAGTSDMKGGDVAIIYALKALNDAGVLDQLTVTVVMTGDEEEAGRPLTVARAELIAAARKSDIALGFEGGAASTATISRRGASSWRLKVTGRQAHSAGIFRPGVGYGAIYEAARILTRFQETLASQPYLTFNPGVIVGGTDVAFDSAHVRGTASSRTNIISREVWVEGDLRFLTESQKDSARSTMRSIVAANLPGTNAEIRFADGYPGMPPTDGNRAVLTMFDEVSRDLGYGPVEALPPEKRGAGDISFVAGIVDALDGLGVDGFGGHSPEEGVYLPSLTMAAERAAVLIYRLGTGKRTGQGAVP